MSDHTGHCLPGPPPQLTLPVLDLLPQLPHLPLHVIHELVEVVEIIAISPKYIVNPDDGCLVQDPVLLVGIDRSCDLTKLEE
jgi:hypothetical protein